jgi:hypothetical protein
VLSDFVTEIIRYLGFSVFMLGSNCSPPYHEGLNIYSVFTPGVRRLDHSRCFRSGAAKLKFLTCASSHFSLRAEKLDCDPGVSYSLCFWRSCKAVLLFIRVFFCLKDG